MATIIFLKYNVIFLTLGPTQLGHFLHEIHLPPKLCYSLIDLQSSLSALLTSETSLPPWGAPVRHSLPRITSHGRLSLDFLVWESACGWPRVFEKIVLSLFDANFLQYRRFQGRSEQLKGRYT